MATLEELKVKLLAIINEYKVISKEKAAFFNAANKEEDNKKLPVNIKIVIEDQGELSIEKVGNATTYQIWRVIELSYNDKTITEYKKVRNKYDTFYPNAMYGDLPKSEGSTNAYPDAKAMYQKLLAEAKQMHEDTKNPTDYKDVIVKGAFWVKWIVRDAINVIIEGKTKAMKQGDIIIIESQARFYSKTFSLVNESELDETLIEIRNIMFHNKSVKLKITGFYGIRNGRKPEDKTWDNSEFQETGFNAFITNQEVADQRALGAKRKALRIFNYPDGKVENAENRISAEGVCSEIDAQRIIFTITYE